MKHRVYDKISYLVLYDKVKKSFELFQILEFKKLVKPYIRSVISSSISFSQRRLEGLHWSQFSNYTKESISKFLSVLNVEVENTRVESCLPYETLNLFYGVGY